MILEDATVELMIYIFSTMFACLLGTSLLLTPSEGGHWLPSAELSRAKRACEIWFLTYGVFWITCFGCIVAFGWYHWFDKIHYIVVCGGLASPLLLQPILFPSITKDEDQPLLERYSFKVTIFCALLRFLVLFIYIYIYICESHSPCSLLCALSCTPLCISLTGIYSSHTHVFIFYCFVSNCNV